MHVERKILPSRCYAVGWGLLSIAFLPSIFFLRLGAVCCLHVTTVAHPPTIISLTAPASPKTCHDCLEAKTSTRIENMGLTSALWAG